jgi:hypothetical protein
MNLEFDFSKLGFLTKRVELQFRDIGGHENLSVNGSQLFVGELTAAPTTVQGIVITVSASPISGGKQGKLVLTGKIRNLRVGGQEFFVDNVCYVK